MKDFTASSESANFEGNDYHLADRGQSGSDALGGSNNSLANQGRMSHGMDLFAIHKGMSYEEWVKIRDEFLRTHNKIK